MRFRFEWERKKTGRRQRRRWLCLFLLCVLCLSGCGSIILNGDLTFTANSPVQPMAVTSSVVQDYMKNVSFAYGDAEKYAISGKRAFVTLPGHVNPADVQVLNQAINDYNAELVDMSKQKKLYKGDFKVIDYNEVTKRFVYAYYTPYMKIRDKNGNPTSKKYTDSKYPEVEDTGLDVAKKTGTASDNWIIERPNGEADVDGAVLVLMSYDPESGDYTVFFSKHFTAEEDLKNDMRCLAGKAGLSSGVQNSEAKNNGGMTANTNISSAGKNYFVFADDYLYLYDQWGNLVYCGFYRSVIQQKASELNWRYGWHAYWRYTVADVELDDRGVPYFTLNMEVSDKDFEQADEQAEKQLDQEVEEDDDKDDAQGDDPEKVGDITYFHGTFSVNRIEIGGANGLSFYSEIEPEAWNALSTNAINHRQEVFDYTKYRKEIITKDVSGNEISRRYETFDETLARLKKDPSAVVSTDAVNEHSGNKLIEEFYNDASVSVSLNQFTGFTANKGGMFEYSLAGGPTVHRVTVLNTDGTRWQTDNYGVQVVVYNAQRWRNYSQASLLNQLRQDQDYACGNLVSVLNRWGKMLPDLKPGLFGGKDYASYNIGDYKESNGDYSVSGSNLIKGHAQPLVSASYFKSGTNYGWGTLLSFNEGSGRIEATADGTGLEAKNASDMVYGNAYHAGRYYYHNSLNSKYWLDQSTSKYDISAQYRLGTNMPYTIIKKTTLDTDGKTSSQYLTIMNDGFGSFKLPVMTLQAKKDISLSYDWVLRDDSASDNSASGNSASGNSASGNSAGKVASFLTKKATVSVPVQYRMMYPEGCYIGSVGETWVGNTVKAGAGDLNALTYYSVNGTRLAQDSVYDTGWWWVQRYRETQYPIYDNASGQKISTAGTYNNWAWGSYWWFLHRYYLNNNFWNFYSGAESEKKFGTLQVEKQGVNGVIYDRMVPGEAQDLGIWDVGDKKIVAYFTDQVIRFYEKKDGETYKTGGKTGVYRASVELRVDELKGLTAGYLLKEEDGNVSSNTTATDMTREEEALQHAEEVLNSDEAMYNLTSDNILPVGNDLKRFLYFSNDGGLHLLYVLNGGTGAQSWQKQGRIMKLLDGSYFRVFPNGNGYEVVGFQTQEYSYSEADVCMARVYDLNLGDLVDQHGNSAVSEYLESLRNYFLTQTHTIRTTTLSGNEAKNISADDTSIVSSNNAVIKVEIVKPNANDAEYARAKKLITGDYEKEAYPELQAICKEYGIDKPTDDSVNVLKNIRANYAGQRAAMTEIYTFLGIDATKLDNNWRYLRYEGQLFNASYQSLLEMTMVQIVLSDFYLKNLYTPQLKGATGLAGVHKYDAAIDGGKRYVYNDKLNNSFIHVYDPTWDGKEILNSEGNSTGATDKNLYFVTNFSATLYVDEYAAYRSQYKDWSSTQANTDIMNELMNTEKAQQRNLSLQSDKINNELYDMMKKQGDTTDFSDSDFYKAVSDDLEDKYLTALRQQENAGQ
ncbi:MAG: hypothetical protein J6M27_08080 [Lachnospiraceae bacterium]|nr:hypothetical protein [Lachnospiraceae bacterium]